MTSSKNVFTSVLELPERLDAAIEKHGIKTRQADPQIEADKEKIKKWFKGIEKPTRRINAYQQLETGHVYPYAYLPENRYYVALMNRLMMITSGDHVVDFFDLNLNNLTGDFICYQEKQYNKLNKEIKSKIDETVIRISKKTEDSKFLQNLIGAILNIELSESNPHADLHNGIKKLLSDEQYKILEEKLSASDIDAIKKLRHDVYAMRNQVDFELRKLKIDINRYIVAENKDKEAAPDLLCLVNASKSHKVTASQSGGSASTEEASAQEASAQEASAQKAFTFKPKYHLGRLSNQKVKQKADLRKKKEINQQGAQVASKALGVGEGTVPAYVAYSVFNPMLGAPLAILTALSAFASGYWFNKFLVQADTEEVLKKLLLNDMLNNMGSVADEYEFEFEFAENNAVHPPVDDRRKLVIIRLNNSNNESNYTAFGANSQSVTMPNKLMSDIAKRLGYDSENLQDFNSDVFGGDAQVANDQSEEAKLAKLAKADLRRHVRALLISYLCEQGVIEGLNERMVKKDIAVILGSLCLSTGLVYGALSAMSIYAGVLTPVLTALHAGFIVSLLGASALAFPVTMTMIGMAAVYFLIIATLISRNQSQNAKDYLKENFIHVFYKRGGRQLPFAILKAFMNFLRIFSILAITLVLAVMSFFLFRGSVDQAIATAFSFFKASDRMIMSLVIAAGNFLVSFPFSFKKLNQLLTINNVITSILYLPASALQLVWTLLSGALIFGVFKLPHFIFKSMGKLLFFVMDQLKNFKFLSTIASALVVVVKAVVNVTAGLIKLPLFVLKFLIAGMCHIFKGNYGDVSLWIERNVIKNLVDVPAKFLIASLCWMVSTPLKTVQFGLVWLFDFIKLAKLIENISQTLTHQSPTALKNFDDKYINFVNVLKCAAFYVNLRLYNLRPGAKMPETSEEFFQQASAIYRLMMIVGILPNSALQGVMFGRNTPDILAVAGVHPSGLAYKFSVAISSWLATENSKSGNLAAADDKMKTQFPSTLKQGWALSLFSGVINSFTNYFSGLNNYSQMSGTESSSSA